MKNINFKTFLTVISIILLITAALLITYFSIPDYKKADVKSSQGFYFDTYIDISLYDYPSYEEADRILNECFSICKRYEDLFSRIRPGTDIYKINSAGTSFVNVDPEVIYLLKETIKAAQISDGEADPTIGALSDLWKIGHEDFSLPSPEEVNSALLSVNYKNIIIENNSVRLTDPSARLDLGFAAKGYAADKVKEYLLSQNISSAVINMGGNILTIGTRPDGKEFTIGIKDPINPSGPPIRVEKVNDLSVVSSGNYERYSEYENKRYHHILSTKNGYPADSGLSQVTIIGKSSLVCDELSTICFILGYEKGSEFLDKYYPDYEAVFVDLEGNLL